MKSKYVAPFRPDVLVVQEVSPADDVLLYAGEVQPTYSDIATESSQVAEVR